MSETSKSVPRRGREYPADLEVRHAGIPGIDANGERDPAVARAPKMRRRGLFALKLIVCVGLMGWILSRVDVTAALGEILRANPWLLLLALGMQVVGAAVMALRWRGLLAVADVRPGLPYLFQSTVCSFFFRQFMPSVVGGDTIRGYDAWRAGASPGFAAFSLVVDRLFGLLALVLFAIASAFLLDRVSSGLPGLRLWAVLALAGLLAILVFIWMPDVVPTSKRLPAKVRQVIAALRVFEGAHGTLAWALALSIVLQANVVTFYWVISQSLGLGLPYGIFYAIVPVAIFAMMAPLSINGIGIREAVFILLLGLWGIDEAVALAFAWVEFGTILGAGLIGGVVYALRSAGRLRADGDSGARGRSCEPGAAAPVMRQTGELTGPARTNN